MKKALLLQCFFLAGVAGSTMGKLCLPMLRSGHPTLRVRYRPRALRAKQPAGLFCLRADLLRFESCSKKTQYRKRLRRPLYCVGWGGRIRTYECSSQSAVSYRLTTPQYGFEKTPRWIVGFEPTVSSATNWRFNQLSYTHHIGFMQHICASPSFSIRSGALRGTALCCANRAPSRLCARASRRKTFPRKVFCSPLTPSGFESPKRAAFFAFALRRASQ